MTTKTHSKISSTTSVTCLMDSVVADVSMMIPEENVDCRFSQCKPHMREQKLESAGDTAKLGGSCKVGCPGKWLHTLTSDPVFRRLAIIIISFREMLKLAQTLISSLELPPCPSKENQEDSADAADINGSKIQSCNEDCKQCLLSSLPEDTFAVAIDDSSLQRKLMARYLKLAGVSKERQLILGSSAEEIYGFDDMVVGLVRKYASGRFLLIVDENLDIDNGPAKGECVSGSLCVQRILSQLTSEESSRVLALVRSANDSPNDCKKYTARAHGYLIKKPVKNATEVLNEIRPWWTRRFLLNERMCYVAPQVCSTV